MHLFLLRSFVKLKTTKLHNNHFISQQYVYLGTNTKSFYTNTNLLNTLLIFATFCASAKIYGGKILYIYVYFKNMSMVKELIYMLEYNIINTAYQLENDF